MVSNDEVAVNLAAAGRLVAAAADAGAALAVLPENFAYFGRHEADKNALAEDDGDGRIQDFLAVTAARHRLWLVGGTIPLRAPGNSDRSYGACLVYDADGRRAARFDKIHLFDVDVPDTEERYKESASTVPGSEAVTVDTPLGRLGLSVCYDLRFPELYRSYAAAGAELLAVPSAFTAATGRAHWEVLVRARAIENLCTVIAPDQGGRHPGGRETWGGSLVVDHWGRILDRVASGPGIAVGDIDRDALRRTREGFPVLEHRRL
jgi:nitrilase